MSCVHQVGAYEFRPTVGQVTSLIKTLFAQSSYFVRLRTADHKMRCNLLASFTTQYSMFTVVVNWTT